MLMLIVMLSMAGAFGLDVVLGAFVAGVIVRRYAPPSSESALQIRMEAIGFGFLVPLFFVVSGATLDILSIIENPWIMLRFFAFIFVARGLTQYFLYRKALPDRRERARFSLLVATGLPILVAITAIEVAAGAMSPANAAALVGAGALTVLLFPLIGNAIDRRRPDQLPERAENVA